MSEAADTVLGGVVARDLACVKCSYNIRTLSAAGKCPECGTAVVASVKAFRDKSVFIHRPAFAAFALVCLGALFAFFGGDSTYGIGNVWGMGGALLIPTVWCLTMAEKPRFFDRDGLLLRGCCLLAISMWSVLLALEEKIGFRTYSLTSGLIDDETGEFLNALVQTVAYGVLLAYIIRFARKCHSIVTVLLWMALMLQPLVEFSMRALWALAWLHYGLHSREEHRMADVLKQIQYYRWLELVVCLYFFILAFKILRLRGRSQVA
jgi:hypothetical protein